MNYEALFMTPGGRTSRGAFIGALIPLLLAAALYAFIVPFFLGQWNLPVLLLPVFVLHARRLHDMGRTAWLLLLPGVLVAVVIALRATGSPAQYSAALAAGVVGAGFAVWGAVGNGQAGANRFGEMVGG